MINNDQGKRLVEQFGQGLLLMESTYEQASKYNAQLRQASGMKEERKVVLELYKQGYELVEKWYQKRLMVVKIRRKIISLVPKSLKRAIKRVLGR